ncbi:MAG: hypothetical protein IJ683_09690 [Butyrivibrio sp.]|nr:hypothetical protein [Butyrivibrio sp.]MBR1642580.1 hypothetical protein [Butyrivibrio sp.]
MKNKIALGLILTMLFALATPATEVYASSAIPDYFDFGALTMSIPAGGSQKMWLRANYDYTYYIEGATSNATYLETDFKSGSKDVVFHIGPDEQSGNVFFHFYVNDEKVQNDDLHDEIEIYVKNRQQVFPSIPAPIAKGKTGTLVQENKVSMLYNDKGVAMASFSLTYGKGSMATFGLKGIEENGSKYFSVLTGYDNATPLISGTDKEVMIANGYAGVVVNGKFINWP